MTEYRDDQLTYWFPPHIKPVYVGVYPTDRGYALWNGNRWGKGRPTPSLARYSPDYCRALQDKYWRGLNFNPAAKNGGAAPKDGKR